MGFYVLKGFLIVLACGVCFIGPTKSESSRFVTLPQSQTIVEDDTVDFNCEASPASELAYSWTRNGQPIQNSSRVLDMGSNLHIESVRRDSDAGDYVCIATNLASGARLASPPARLSVIWIQSASVQLVSNNRNEVELKCRVEGSSGDGLLEIEWFRNNEKLGTIKNIELRENRLSVRRPGSDDSGLYRCIASNAAGRVMSKKGYMLKWTHERGELNSITASSCIPRLKRNHQQRLPEPMREVFLCRGKRGGAGGMLPPPQPQPPSPFDENQLPESDVRMTTDETEARKIVKENEAIDLPCGYEIPEKYFQQNTPVHVRWRKDGKVFRQIELGSNARMLTTSEPSKDPLLREDHRMVVNRSNGSLQFSTVLANDAGQYLCQVIVDKHRPATSRAIDLQVIEQLKFVPQPTSKNLELGLMGKVPCKAQGTPTPQVKWIRDQPFENVQLIETIDDINGTLIFKNVTAEHRGNYTCTATNSQGQINATVAISVVVAPRFSVAPNETGDSIEVSEGGVAVTHCQAIGIPRPTIQWDKDLQYLSENNTDRTRFRFLENGTLQIVDVHAEDDGHYGCTIGNSAGLKRVEVRLIVKEESADGFLITRAVLITMSVAFAYIILVVGLMIWCRYRRQARKARLAEAIKDNPESADTAKTAENEPCLPDGGGNGGGGKQHHNGPTTHKMNGHNNPRGSGTEAQKSDDTACSNHSKGSKRSHAFDQLGLPRSSISELIQIGRGEFGDVFIGKIKAAIIAAQNDEKDADNEKQQHAKENGNGNGTSNGNGNGNNAEKRRSKTSMDDIEEIKEEHEDIGGNRTGGDGGNPTMAEEYKLILVKALNKIKDEYACQEFKRQIEMFRAISHRGVVRLFGLCREKDPHFMVLEYTDWGDLKQFLLATAGKVNTSANSSKPPALKTGQILAVAYQIARGMDAIYRARFIHKDLATRNCVISSDFIVKVSYPALSKDKYSREYHKHRNSLLPIRWLAPECIQEDDYTTKSDIFAFGVTVWELFNQATKIPFEDCSNEEVIQRSQTGKLEWSNADGTPECLKEILLSCWITNPKERPSFSQLCSALSKAIQNSDKK